MGFMDEKFLKPYSPNETEDRIYKMWEDSGFFNPDICLAKNITADDSETFSIVLPPPNVTGTLHMGHAAMLAIEDIMVRYHRMKGHQTLWLPGTDHAAIATQTKVEKILQKEKTNRHELGREKFLERVEKFAQESHDTIANQMRKMGSSVDWSREAFTLDKKREVAVRTAFKKMYDEELIYRGHRIVNWDPKGQTTISDDEIVRKEETTKFYYLKYGPFTIGTSRPETKFGDKYVVMHPDDKRYAKYKEGQTIDLEWINGPITATIIKDEAIDMEFGTGVMTITPWHDATDFGIAERHNLDKEQVIDEYGKLLPIAQEFAGIKISIARDQIVEKLQNKGLVERIDDGYVHNIATAERTGGIIEPQIKEQWFVAVNKKFVIPHSEIEGIPSGSETTLKELMLATVRKGQIDIIPERFERVYFDWIENLHDWCISRQIWYGHRIPVWYHENKCVPIEGREDDVSKCIKTIVSESKPKCEHCDAEYTQDTDTLDTWFSSGLWTFSTLGWPEETSDLKKFHPTTILETGYDIIFFWVARMILMTTYLLGTIPFKTVYMHGLVRDSKGIKMSKSLGNVIDPLDMTEKYGADATRLSLIIGTGPGNDTRLSEDKIRAYKKFANKLWNISRFIFENTEDTTYDANFSEYTEDDAKIKAELSDIITDITRDIENYRFYLAGEKLYHYAWHNLADTILEESKEILITGDANTVSSRKQLLLDILKKLLLVLHPFTPFVTEEIWSSFPQETKQLLLVEKWPNQ
ncbi:valine--tRNA ligase [Candidatus Wolfebacteria bacterium]|nr:MAG: valine--tRNA ligase [Candidatus Wolfebacteria bacterium]